MIVIPALAHVGFILITPVDIVHANGALSYRRRAARSVNIAYIVSIEYGDKVCLITLADGSALTVLTDELLKELDDFNATDQR